MDLAVAFHCCERADPARELSLLTGLPVAAASKRLFEIFTKLDPNKPGAAAAAARATASDTATIATAYDTATIATEAEHATGQNSARCMRAALAHELDALNTQRAQWLERSPTWQQTAGGMAEWVALQQRRAQVTDELAAMAHDQHPPGDHSNTPTASASATAATVAAATAVSYAQGECIICLETTEVVPGCSKHAVCDLCLRTYFEACLQSHDVTFACPSLQCRRNIKPEHLCACSTRLPQTDACFSFPFSHTGQVPAATG
jgi:hypothetical protein